MRRVLVVEDDAAYSARALAASCSRRTDVEIVAAATGGEALSRCSSEHLRLHGARPDAAGHDRLRAARAGWRAARACSFPPVIVYTGRSLTRDEEQRLRRYSSSIIIKGARSPERLLDEVTLFLHQVESELPPEQQRMLREARSREAVLEGRRILVVEDDVRNVFALSSVLEPRGASSSIARNGREALDALAAPGRRRSTSC